MSCTGLHGYPCISGSRSVLVDFDNANKMPQLFCFIRINRGGLTKSRYALNGGVSQIEFTSIDAGISKSHGEVSEMNACAVESETRERRPKQDRSVLVRMDHVLVEQVDRLAARERTTRSDLVRRLLLDLLKRDVTEREGAKRAA